MTYSIRVAALAVVLQCVGAPGLEGQARPFPLAVAVRVPLAPAPIASGDDRYLCYELVLGSYLRDTAWVRRVEVFGDATNGSPLVRYQGDQLADNMVAPGPNAPGTDRLAIGPGTFRRIYVWVRIPAGQIVPLRLINRLSFDVKTPDGPFRDTVEHTTPVRSASSVLVVGPPLRGGPWAAFNGPSNSSGHRRTPLVLAGRDALAQRYAIDYMKLAPDGAAFTGDSTKNENYPGNGEDVIAVDDGMVSWVQTGIAENTPFVTTRPDPFNLQTVIGNQVILDLGGGYFALYAHLMPGSVVVEVGDRVRRGQTLGRVGNTGNSGGPHLHFHIIDDNVALGAEGLPYLIEGFDLLGRCERTMYGCTLGPPRKLIRSMPLLNQVVRFK